MKIKVTILTAFMVCGIFLAFDSFIYFTLNQHLMDMEQNLLFSKAQSIAQYYVNHLTDDDHSNPSTWLSHYNEDGQSILLFSPSGQQLARVGNLATTHDLVDFKPSTLVRQRVFTTHSAMVMVTNAPAIDQDNHKLLGYVLLVSNLNNIQSYMNTLLAVLIIGSLGAVALAGFGSFFISRAAVHPINQMIRLIERIQANRLNERVQVPERHDEVSRLASTFNNMLVRIERSFEQQARFVADASHEFRTPLTTIQGYADLLRRWGKDDPQVLNKALHVIHQEADRLKKLADDLLTLASLEASSSELPPRASVVRAVDEVVDSLGLLHPEITLIKTLEGTPEVAMAPAHLKQVLTNLLDNAIKHTPAEGTVEVSTALTPHHVLLLIRDTGAGIPSEDLPYIFERFYRVDKARGRRAGGTGLGLAIVKGLIEMYGGNIRIESEVEVGTTVKIQLPLASPA